jgi:hypothetical protein
MPGSIDDSKQTPLELVSFAIWDALPAILSVEQDFEVYLSAGATIHLSHRRELPARELLLRSSEHLEFARESWVRELTDVSLLLALRLAATVHLAVRRGSAPVSAV